MKILVTGAAGYIGSVLCPMLLNNGHKVVAFDSFHYQQYTALAACCRYKNFEIIRGDVRTDDTLLAAMKDVDIIIPLAALVGAPLCDMSPSGANTVNWGVISFIADHVSKNQLIIYPNTNSAYGTMPKGRTEPLTEDETDLTPLSVYARTKQEAEFAVLAKTQTSIVFRLATVFGASPRMRTDLLVNDFVQRAVRDKYLVLMQPFARRNYVHVNDVARAFLWAVEKFAGGSLLLNHRIYNLGHDGSNCHKRELCVKINKQIPDFNWETQVGEDPDRRDYIISNERLRKAGFVAKTSLDDGIAELIKLYQAFPTTPWGNI